MIGDALLHFGERLDADQIDFQMNAVRRQPSADGRH